MGKLRKVQVTTGVYWIEVPEANLYVLCGCPADSVKHMMKRGLIVPSEMDGMAYETGPNAILLSDVMLQNGSFCNLAEFPVLQMLYRQGMILPNHPNNTGLKPLLIGRGDQVKAQMAYIYRGNYGLTSEEEMIAAGADPALAADMMRMKLKFAFGAIRPTSELLDSIRLEDEPVDVRGGVMLRRLSLNKFEFSYGDEKAVVDLSLPPFETYDCPYPLGVHQVKREYFAVLHCGDGDGWDVNRPSMSSILMYQGKIYLIDAGPNIIFTLMALGIGVNEIEGVFHTHCHDDHFAGLTTLIRSDHRVKYFATPMVRHSVAKKMSALLSIDEDRLSDYFDIRDLESDAWNDIEGLEVKPVFSPHPVETNILFFRALWEGGYRTYAHFADIVSLDVLKGMITDDATAPGISQATYDKVARDYSTMVNVKKLDIGGGLIHGTANDFGKDGSEKIILSHIARKLTDAEKAIGSGAPFGIADVLIPANQDYIWRYAYEFLHSYFPNMPNYQFRVLMNNPLVTFNPESILVKEGATNNDIFFVLTGNVEVFSTESAVRSILSAGALIGELSGLHGMPSMETFRAASFVQALRLPGDLYLEFVKRNDLFGGIALLMENREYLQKTWLCSEIVSTKTLNQIAQAMRPRSLKAGEEINPDTLGAVCLIKYGEVHRSAANGTLLETMVPGDFFGEETAIFNRGYGHMLKVIDPTEVYVIPPDVLGVIPGVRWKLFETFQRRQKA